LFISKKSQGRTARKQYKLTFVQTTAENFLLTLTFCQMFHFHGRSQGEDHGVNHPWLSQLMYAVENGVKVFTVNNFQNFSTIRERGGGAGGRKNVPREKATVRCRTRRSSGRETHAVMTTKTLQQLKATKPRPEFNAPARFNVLHHSRTFSRPPYTYFMTYFYAAISTIVSGVL